MQQAIERLDLTVVRGALEARARTPLGAHLGATLGPLAEPSDARERIEATSQIRGLIEQDLPPPVEGASDVTAALELAEKGIMLDGPQLRATAATMQASAALRRYLLTREEETPLLYGIGASVRDLSRTAGEINRCFGADGQLADNASEMLGTLRRRLRSLRGGVEEKLHELMASSRIKSILQETYFTVRGNRYVLPIKASFKNNVRGIVHDASGTGQTVFIEPQEIVEHGNRLKIAESEVKEEEDRILTRLTLLVVDDAEATKVAMDAIGKVDLLASCARFATDLDCHPIVPEVTPGFDLIAARHPQLVLQQMANPELRLVANDIGLDPKQRVLILTGPNTGGKTVAMKTVGLLAVMVRCGLHLPASPRSTIGWFEAIETAIGDDQSIASNLSTFAAHVRALSQTLTSAMPGTLVLVDEIAADTDPSQGQALAQAILEAFADGGAHVVVTTHFEGLKAIPFVDERFRNAGVGFDPERLLPTYRVTLDLPQGSSGFDIAASLGLSEVVVERARSLTGEGNVAIEAFTKSLQEKAAALERAKEEATETKGYLEAARAELDAQREALAETQRTLIEGDRAALIAEISASRVQVRAIIAELQAVAGSAAVSDAMRLANETAAKVAQIEASERAKQPAPIRLGDGATLESVQVGDWVHVARLERDGTVVAVDAGGTAIIAIGNMRTRSELDGLEPARTKPPKQTRANLARMKENLQESRAPKAPVFTSDLEIDLRGLNSDEAAGRLDGFLDHHFGGPTTHVRVVHGHGTGALKTAIRAHLKRSGYVRSYRPGDDNEGGDGATVVELS